MKTIPRVAQPAAGFGVGGGVAVRRWRWLPAVVLASVTAWAAETKPKVEDLGWLAGTWRLERSGRVVTERWTAPEGGMMLGTSQTVRDGKTLEYEFVVIRADAAGELQYVAKPSRQPEASFKLVRLTGREALFENPAHDYPQRISYALQADGSLLAAIDGEQGGKARRVEFHYQPVK